METGAVNWDEIRSLLTQPPYKMKEYGAHLREGVCPQCGKKSLWTPHANEPNKLICDHINKCGWEGTAKDLFPDLFELSRIVKNNPPTPENPNATADAYLKARGFTISRLAGFYSQHAYDYLPREAKEAGLPSEPVLAVRFYLRSPMQGAWDRFIDSEHFGKKTYLHGGTKLNEWCWTPPDQQLGAGDELFLTEGIFDALALRETGRKVAAIMGSSNKPQAFITEHKAWRLRYVVALDNDKAGQAAAVRLVKWLKEQGEDTTCIQPAAEASAKVDWNDLLIAKRLTDKHFEDYRYWGSLLTARSAAQKALTMFNRTGERFFVFAIQRNTHVWNLDMKAFDAAVQQIRETEQMGEEQPLSEAQREEALKQCDAISHLANCELEFLYTQQNPITDELYYFFRVLHADGRVTLNTFTGAQLAAAADFRKRLLSAASGALIRANQDAHNWLLSRWMGQIKDVDVVGFAGYSATHQAWIFPRFAMHKGKYIPTNAEEYLELSSKARVKSAYHSVDIRCNPKLAEYNDAWFNDLYTAWGAKGIIALAFFTLSLFSQQVREMNKSLTFLELVGDPGTGKTTLIEFLWKLFGRDNFEGFDPSSANPAYVARVMNQLANLPAVMIEGDRGARSHRGKFDWAEVKKLYNGRAMKGRGMRTQGNETYEPPFLGSLVISQNAPVDAEQAVLERIVHVYFHKYDTTTETLGAVKRLMAHSSDEVSGYLIKCLSQADALIEVYKAKQAAYEEGMRKREEQKTYRLALNHSQIAAAIEMLSLCTPITQEQRKEALTLVLNLSIERERAIAREHPDVEQFLEVVDYLLESNIKLNHGKEGELAINLNEIYAKAAEARQELAPVTHLKSLLRVSRRYVDTKAIHSSACNKTVRCWIFRVK